jgi:hypothetical protein
VTLGGEGGKGLLCCGCLGTAGCRRCTGPGSSRGLSGHGQVGTLAGTLACGCFACMLIPEVCVMIRSLHIEE